MTLSGGWGAGPWGSSPWGAGDDEQLAILGAVAVRENVVRVTFNQAPIFDRTLSPNDASDPDRWSVVADTSTIGLDGEAARPVLVVAVEVADIVLSFGAEIDVTVDRPFSPFPTYYRVSANQLIAQATMMPLDPAASSFRFQGLYRILRNPQTEATVPSRDLANPQDYEAMLIGGDALPGAPDASLLGTFPVDASGDYAFDQGLVQIKKRIFRRLMTTPGSFAHIPDYGVGIPTFAKKLNTAATRAKVVAESQRQILLEPGVVEATVSAETDPTAPNVTRFRIRARTSAFNVEFDFPIAPP